MQETVTTYFYQFVDMVFGSPLTVGAAFAVAGAVLSAIFNTNRKEYLRGIIISALVGIIIFTAIYFTLIVSLR